MNWLSQNWIWIALAVGAFFLIRGRGGMAGCGMGHSTGHGHGSGGDNRAANDGVGPGTAFDPVSHRAVNPGGPAISSVYHGRAYYFESRENRDAFEGAPEKYLAGASTAGQPIGSDDVISDRPRRRHGC